MIDFQYFVSAHLKWREKLSHDKTNADFDIETIRCDDKCEIGQWFHGPGHTEYATLAAFSDAKEAHANFHRTVAASLVETGHAGSDEQFEVLVKALKLFSDAITPEVKETACAPHVIEDVCLKAFKRAAIHIDNKAPELAGTVLKALPCDARGSESKCSEIGALFSKIKATKGANEGSLQNSNGLS